MGKGFLPKKPSGGHDAEQEGTATRNPTRRKNLDHPEGRMENGNLWESFLDQHKTIDIFSRKKKGPNRRP